MKKNDLLKKDNSIIRVLALKNDGALIIDCLKRTMPVLVDLAELKDYEPCSEEELLSVTNVMPSDIDNLSADERKVMHERYTLIAGILPFVSDEKKRSSVISLIAEENNISKQTVRKYLCNYLAYQNIAVFVPQQKASKPLSQDEKNIRWALNKFYYTCNKNSLNTAYMLMLKAKYCNTEGTLKEHYPSIHQFRYFYRKHKKMQNYFISRNGLSNYQRNNRPLLGDGIQQLASNVGTAMLDSTICDIYLVDEAGTLIGRPILTACIDAYSGLCCGYHLSWDNGIGSLRSLMANVIADKVQHCKRFGISISKTDWNCDKLPAVLITDKGMEYQSGQFEQLADLGVKIVNLPPYRPELKGAVEKFFDVVQNLYKKHLKGKGVVEPDFQERGSRDYRKEACLTMANFEKILLHCIIYYNSKRILEHFPYTEEMLEKQVKPYANCVWNYCLTQAGANLIEVDYNTLTLTLLPRTTGKFTRKGLVVNKLRYKRDDCTEQYLQGGEVQVAYSPDDVSIVWYIAKNEYIAFKLVENRFKGKSLSEVDSVVLEAKNLVNNAKNMNIQAQIKLADHIDTIAQNGRYNVVLNHQVDGGRYE